MMPMLKIDLKKKVMEKILLLCYKSLIKIKLKEILQLIGENILNQKSKILKNI